MPDLDPLIDGRIVVSVPLAQLLDRKLAVPAALAASIRRLQAQAEEGQGRVCAFQSHLR